MSKKRMKLPNGYGSIKNLGKNRRRPYAVHPPTTEFNKKGHPITPKAICYVDTYIKAFAVLTAYHAGTYYPGFENTLPSDLGKSGGDEIINKILADYSLTKSAEERDKIYRPTFEDVYHMFWEWKFVHDQSKAFAKSTMNMYSTAFGNCPSLHSRIFKSLKHNDLQNCIDTLNKSHSSKKNLLSLFKQMYVYAEIYELCDKDHSAHLKINSPDDTEHGEPFNENDMKILWANTENTIAELILILCYSGFRIGALETLYINLEQMYFKGGIKTNAGKDRIVPIHSSIQPLVKRRLERQGVLLDVSINTFRRKMYDFLSSVGIEKHGPHDCRHTFSMLCERYEVKENDRKRLLGHSFSDVTNDVYGHRSLEDLRTEIEKIKVCY